MPRDSRKVYRTLAHEPNVFSIQQCFSEPGVVWKLSFITFMCVKAWQKLSTSPDALQSSRNWHHTAKNEQLFYELFQILADFCPRNLHAVFAVLISMQFRAISFEWRHHAGRNAAEQCDRQRLGHGWKCEQNNRFERCWLSHCSDSQKTSHFNEAMVTHIVEAPTTWNN